MPHSLVYKYDAAVKIIISIYALTVMTQSDCGEKGLLLTMRAGLNHSALKQWLSNCGTLITNDT